MPVTGTRYMIIANPGAGRGRAPSLVLQTARLLKRQGCVFDLELTRGPRDAARLAREACRDHDVIVAVGGDGTVNEVASGMLFSDRPLGIVPAGSGNDFIKSLGIPNHLGQAVEILLRGRSQRVDAGTVNGRYFVNGAGIGLDAAVNKESYSVDHSRRGLPLYFRALLRTLGAYRAVPMTITMNGTSFGQDVLFISIGNGTTVGGGFRLTAHARLDDGLLDVTVVKPIGLLPLLWHLPKVFRGTIDRAAKYVVTGRTDRLVVESSRPVPVHLDGEIYEGEESRFEIAVVPAALTVIGNF
jgi:YegS/Rv2252/BmrU family lipid kinase